MFIIKYALKSISRSLGRNILIGIIVLIISTAACVAMSIQQAAEKAAANTLKDMNISAQLNVDRGYIYNKAQEKTGSQDMNELMPEMNSLMKEYSLDLDGMEEYKNIKKPGSSESIVKTFYYNSSLSINGSDIEKYDLTATTEAATEAATEAPTVQKMTDPAGNEVEMPTAPQMQQQEPEQLEKAGDFDLVGYNSYAAMEVMAGFGTDDDAACKITDGTMFEDNTSEYVCVINEDLLKMDANKDKKVGDSIELVNPKNEDETYSLKIAALYKDSSGSTAMGTDPANIIITSYSVVKDIESKSESTNNSTSSSSSNSKDSTKSTTATTAATTSSSSSSSSSGSSDEESNALVSQFNGTFVFGSVADYEQFKEEIKTKAKSDGMDEDLYIVTSSDVATFKAGLKPLENLKSFATTFLYLTLAIGAIVLIVISVISIRDRKYEIGALAAMGLKKLKLSMMFMIEVLTVTLVAILIGAIAGSAASVPVTSYLLSAQVEQQQSENASVGKQQAPGMQGGNMERPEDGEYDASKVEYVNADDIGFSVDMFVILKMLAIGIMLAVVSGFTSILFILRYDPKQILANRD